MGTNVFTLPHIAYDTVT